MDETDDQLLQRGRVLVETEPDPADQPQLKALVQQRERLDRELVVLARVHPADQPEHPAPVGDAEPRARLRLVARRALDDEMRHDLGAPRERHHRQLAAFLLGVDDHSPGDEQHDQQHRERRPARPAVEQELPDELALAGEFHDLVEVVGVGVGRVAVGDDQVAVGGEHQAQRTAEQANAMIDRGYLALALGFDWSLFQRGIAAAFQGIKR